MIQPPAPAPGTRLFPLGTEAILFSEPRQEIHAFNTTAALIWCLVEDGMPEDAIARDLAARTGIAAAAAEGFVAAALAEWAAKGLLAGTAGPPCAAPPRGWEARTGLPARSVPTPCIATRTYRLLTTRFVLHYARDEQFAVLHPILAHLEEAGPAEVRFDLAATGDATVIYRDHEPIDACTSNDCLGPAAYTCIWMTVLRRHRFFVSIHAGVLRAGGFCVLLPAPPGSGKSILTAALVHSGFEYFSDEVAPLSSPDLAVTAFPQAICIKETGLAAVAAFCPEAGRLPLHRRADGRCVAYLPPRRDRLPEPGAHAPVRALIFPRYGAGAGTTCTQLSVVEALARLLGQCSIIERRLDAAGVENLLGWVGGLSCRELVYSDVAEAVGVVAGIVDEVRSTQRTRNIQTAR